MSSGKKLEKLFIDEEKISEELLYDLLEPYVRFATKTNEIIPTSNFSKLKADQKILVILVAIKALFLLGKRKNDRITPKELEKMTSIKGNTIRPVLKKFYDSKTILKDAKEGYFVPSITIPTIREILQQDQNKKQN